MRNYSNTVVPTNLNGGVTDSATSWTVDDGSTYPAVPFTARCESEVVLVTAKSGTNDVNWTVERGFDGTTAAAHSDSSVVDAVVVAADFYRGDFVFSGAEIELTANSSDLTTGVWTDIDWDAQVYDTDGYWEGVTNPERITFSVAGKYLVIANVIFETSSSGFRHLRFLRNADANLEIAQSSTGGTSAGDTRAYCSAVVDADAGDYVVVQAYQNSGGGLYLTGHATADYEKTRLWVYLISPTQDRTEGVWTSPPSTGWSWVNQGSSTITSSSNPTREVLVGVHSGTSTNVVARVRSYTAPATFTVRLDGISFVKNYNGFGLCFRDSSTGELVDLDISNSTESLTVNYMASATSWSSSPFTVPSIHVPKWVRIEDNNTNFLFSVSENGWDWQQLYSVSRTAHLTTPDQVGFQVSTQNSTTPNMDQLLTILSWEET